jgi:hypothetical protein
VKTLAIVTSLLLASCAVDEIIAATSDGPPDAGHRSPMHTCSTNADCHDDERCAKPTCDEKTGECVPRPTVCPPDLAPSCGCDGITYFNDCWRRVRGVAASTPNECEANVVLCGGPTHATCPAGSTCALLSSDPPTPMCPADSTGVCWVLPPRCSPNTPGDIYGWIPCGPPAPCVDTCNAIRAGVPHGQMLAGCP